MEISDAAVPLADTFLVVAHHSNLQHYVTHGKETHGRMAHMDESRWSRVVPHEQMCLPEVRSFTGI